MGNRLEDEEIDERIISILERDARVSNREIGRVLGVSEGYVRKRLKRLLEGGELKFGVLVSSAASGMMCSSFLRFRVAPESITAVAEALAEIEEVRFVGLAVGRFDVYAVTLTKSREALHRLVHERIDILPGISFVDVREIMNVLKYAPNQVRIK